MNRLFRVFDSDGSGVIDIAELSSGLSILCGGSEYMKMKYAFILFGTCQTLSARWCCGVGHVLAPTLRCPGVEFTTGVRCELRWRWSFDLSWVAQT